MFRKISKSFIAAIGLIVTSDSVFSQTTLTVTCTGTSGSYKSGGVTAAGALTDGTITVSGPNASPGSTRGWAVFDLSTLSLPAGSIIYDATIKFRYPNAPTGNLSTPPYAASATIYGNTGDLSALAIGNQGGALYNDLVKRYCYEECFLGPISR